MDSRRPLVAIYGLGTIGSAVAYALTLQAPALDLCLVNRNRDKARGLAQDLGHCVPMTGAIRIRDAGEAEGADVVLLAAGALPRPDGRRADVLKDNLEIYSALVPGIAKRNPRAVLLTVTNPVDLTAYAAYRLSGFPARRVLGTGTLLDSLRLRGFLGAEFGLDPSRIGITVIGEHGDSMVPVWSSASFEGAPLEEALARKGTTLDGATKDRLLQRTRRAGWELREAGVHSVYGIALCAVTIIRALLGLAPLGATGATGATIPVSNLTAGELGLGEVFLSLPATLGPGGVVEKPELALDQGERRALAASAGALEAGMRDADAYLG